MSEIEILNNARIKLASLLNTKTSGLSYEIVEWDVPDDPDHIFRAILKSDGSFLTQPRIVPRIKSMYSSESQKTGSLKTADFNLSDLGTKLKSFANDYKWPLIGTAAVGIPAIATIAMANRAAETSPEYANPKYLNEDGSFLPSFTSIRQLQGNEDNKLIEALDNLAYNKFLKEHEGFYNWENGLNAYSDFEQEFYTADDVAKNGLMNKVWNYLDDNELPTLQDARNITNVFSSHTPYYEGQKPILKQASLKTADFKTRFGQDLGGFLSHMAYGGLGGALLGGLYHDMTGGTPDDLISDMSTGMGIGASLSGLYGGINTHIGMNDKIKGLQDLLSKRFTSGVSPDYQARTDNLKNILNNLTNGGFIAGLKEVF